MNDRLTDAEEEIQRLKLQHNKLETALFAKDNNNEFGMPGLMVSMQKVDKHIDVTCNIAIWLRRLIVGMLGLGAPAAAIGHYFKLWG